MFYPPHSANFEKGYLGQDLRELRTRPAPVSNVNDPVLRGPAAERFDHSLFNVQSMRDSTVS